MRSVRTFALQSGDRVLFGLPDLTPPVLIRLLAKCGIVLAALCVLTCVVVLACEAESECVGINRIHFEVHGCGGVRDETGSDRRRRSSRQGIKCNGAMVQRRLGARTFVLGINVLALFPLSFEVYLRVLP